MPYNQDFLEAAAHAYGAHDAADLLTINPLQVDTIATLLSQVRLAPPGIRRQAYAVIEALLKAS